MISSRVTDKRKSVKKLVCSKQELIR